MPSLHCIIMQLSLSLSRVLAPPAMHNLLWLCKLFVLTWRCGMHEQWSSLWQEWFMCLQVFVASWVDMFRFYSKIKTTVRAQGGTKSASLVKSFKRDPKFLKRYVKINKVRNKTCGFLGPICSALATKFALLLPP